MRSFWAGFRLQLRLLRSYPDSLLALLTAPFFSVIFLAIVRDAGREGLERYAVLGPILMTLLYFTLYQAGGVVQFDRWMGVLEGAVAAPANLAGVLLGRIAAVIAVGLLVVPEVWLIARLAFGVRLPIHHEWAFVATLAATALALAATGVVLASLFVLTRNAFTFQNSASYPLYVLGGVLVPVSLLPGWLRPLSSVVFLSWSADLLRATARPEPIDALAWRLGVVVAFAVATFAVGRLLLGRILRRARETGELTAA